MDREFRGAERVLLRLAESAALLRDDMPAFWSELRATSGVTGAISISLVGADANIRLSTLWPYDQQPRNPAPGSDREAARTGNAVIGELHTSGAEGRPRVSVAIGWPRKGGMPEAQQGQALSYALPLDRFSMAMAVQGAIPGSMMMLTDRAGALIATSGRTSEPGHRLPPALLGAISGDGGPGTILPYVDPEHRRMIAFQAVAAVSGYRIFVTLPQSHFEAPLVKALLQVSLFGVLLVAISLALALWAASGLARSLRQIGSGAPLPAAMRGVRELNDLADTLAAQSQAQSQAQEAALARLQALFDRSPVGVIRADAGGRVQEANDAFLGMIGMSRADLAAGRVHWDDLTPPEWIGRDETAIAEAMRLGGCAPYQKEFVRPDGRHVPVLMFFAFTDPRLGAAAAFVVDISAWSGNDPAMARAQEQMRLAMGAAGIFFWDWNIPADTVECSPGLEATYGLPQGRFDGRFASFRQMVHPDDMARVEATMSASLAGGTPYSATFRVHRAGGSIRWVTARGTVLRDGAGQPVRMVGIDLDATEQALQATAAQLSRVHRIARIGDFEHDLATGVSRRSGQYMRLHGLPAVETLERHEDWQQRLHPDDQDLANAAINNAILDPTIVEYANDYRIVLPDGEIRWLSSRVEIERDDTGRALRLLGAHLDITDLRRAEGALSGTETQLRLAMEAAEIGAWDWCPKTGSVIVSEGYRRIWHLAPDATAPSYEDWLARINPADRGRIEAKTLTVVAGGAYEDEFEAMRFDGTAGWFLTRVHVAWDEATGSMRGRGINMDITSRKQTQFALARSEERSRLAQDELAAIYDATPVGIGVVDPGLRVRNANPAFAAIGGSTPGALIGLGIKQWLPALWPRLEPLLTAVSERGESFRDWNFDDAGRHWQVALLPLRNAAGAMTAISIVALDVTAEHQAAQVLASSEQRLRQLTDAVPALVFLTGSGGGVTYTNARFSEYTGQPAAGLIGPGCWAMIHPEDRRAAALDQERARRQGKAYEAEYRLRRADGAWRWFLMRCEPLRGEDGAKPGWIGSLTDIQDWRAAQTALSDAELRLNLAVEAAELGSWSWDLRSGTLDSTPRCRILYGVTEDAAFDWDTLSQTVAGEDQPLWREATAEALANRSGYAAEYRVNLADGPRWRRSVGRVVTGPDGAAVAIRGVVYDIDDRKRAEAALRADRDRLEQQVAERTRALTETANELALEMTRREQAQAALLQSQKLEAMGQLTGGVAHDFNNILAIIQGIYRLLEPQLADDAEAQELVRYGQDAADRGARLIAQLLAFARKEELQPERVEPGRLLRTAENLIARTAGSRVECAFDIADDVWSVIIDPLRLETVLLNLTTNARDAMPNGGTITISARRALASELPPELPRERDYMLIAVNDTGLGMDGQTLQRAIEPFFTTKERGKGTGLGLASAHGFAVQSGGTLRLHSALGQGTSIEIFLPRAALLANEAPLLEEETGASLLDPSRHGNATILLVDDDDGVRVVTARLLRGFGYRVVEAQNAEVAEAMAFREERIDMLVTDVVMPGAYGHILSQRLRNERPDLPVLYCSGFKDDARLDDAPMLTKPYTPIGLARAVLQGLGRLQPGGARQSPAPPSANTPELPG